MDIGSSMGPESSSGTVGLYLKIRSSSEDTIVLEPTNYHVIPIEALNEGMFYFYQTFFFADAWLFI